jgi:hypothetical protein
MPINALRVELEKHHKKANEFTVSKTSLALHSNRGASWVGAV